MLSRAGARSRMAASSLARRMFGTETASLKVGFVGLGRMGSGMVRNLLEAGHSPVVYDRYEPAVEALVADGASGAGSSGEVAGQVDVLISMLPNDAAVKEEGLGAGGIVEQMKQGGIHISSSTISPHTSTAMSVAHEARGASYVAAPVFARPDGIVAKQASFAVSGSDGPVEVATSLLETSGKVFRFGESAGGGNVVKLCGNYLIASTIESISEALALAEAHGLDRVDVMNMLNSTIFDCLIYKGYGQRVSERDHKPGGFALTLGLKDVSLVLDTAGKAGVPMPVGSVLKDRWMAAQSKGWGGMDWSAVGLAVSENAGVDVKADVEKALKQADEDAAGK